MRVVRRSTIDLFHGNGSFSLRGLFQMHPSICGTLDATVKSYYRAKHLYCIIFDETRIIQSWINSVRKKKFRSLPISKFKNKIRK